MREALYIWNPTLILVCLHTFDLLITQKLLALGGVEGNPVMSFVLTWGGFEAMCFKVGGAVLCGIVLTGMGKYGSLLLLNVISAGLVLWNLALFGVVHFLIY